MDPNAKLQAELAAHLGHDKHEAVANESGKSARTITSKVLADSVQYHSW